MHLLVHLFFNAACINSKKQESEKTNLQKLCEPGTAVLRIKRTTIYNSKVLIKTRKNDIDSVFAQGSISYD